MANMIICNLASVCPVKHCGHKKQHKDGDWDNCNAEVECGEFHRMCKCIPVLEPDWDN